MNRITRRLFYLRALLACLALLTLLSLMPTSSARAAPATPQIVTGVSFSCALRTNGTVVCWGPNFGGAATPPVDLTDVIQIDEGLFHVCALKSDGTVVCWGSNFGGGATPPPGLTGATQVVAGAAYGCALKSDTTVVCWGDAFSSGAATPPAGLTSVTKLSAGEKNTCAQRTDGTLVCWGDNYAGANTPPAATTGALQFAVGYGRSCAVKSDTTVVCWGDNSENAATPPAGLTGVSQVGSGEYFTCAVKSDGTVVCWGYNPDGRGTPPPSLTGVTQVATGDYTCAVKSDGTVVCWGSGAQPPAGLDLDNQSPTTISLSPTSVAENQPPGITVGTFSTTDPDPGDTFTYALVSGQGDTDNGAFTIDGSTLKSAASFDFETKSSYTIRVRSTDRNGAFTELAFTISVSDVDENVAPNAQDDSYAIAEDTSLTQGAPGVLGNDTDDNGNPLTAVKVSDPAHGTLMLNADGSFTYTPAANYNGPDSFTYKANDSKADSNVATVNITVNAVNDVPVATNDSYSTNEDTALTIAAPGVLGNDSDADGGPLTAVQPTTPGHGTVTLNADGSFTYTPVANYNGPDSFTYKANDGTTDSNAAIVNITVNPVNDAPVANADSYSTAEDTALTIAAPGVLTNDNDIDGNPLTAVKVTDPAHGTLMLSQDGSFLYTPVPNYNGLDSFTYTVNDGTADSSAATVTITVTPVNDAPVANADSYSTTEDTTLTIAAPGVLTNDNDIDGNPLTASVVTGPSHGTVTLNPDGSFTYTPALNYNGPDSFTYKVNDGSADSTIATVNITITPVEDIPLYGVDNTDNGYSQLVIIDPFTGVATPFGPRQTLDIEDLALHPTTGVLYASTGGNGSQKGWLYRVDRTTGALTAIGQTDKKGVMALTFRTSDATLWGWVEGTGLIQINLTTAQSTVITKNTAKFEGIAWAPNGKLYLARAKTLTEYNPTNQAFTTYATNLPKGTEALDILANGRLVGGARDGNTITLFTYNLTTKQVTITKILAGAPGFSLKSIEGFTWHASLTPPPGF